MRCLVTIGWLVRTAAQDAPMGQDRLHKAQTSCSVLPPYLWFEPWCTCYCRRLSPCPISKLPGAQWPGRTRAAHFLPAHRCTS